jgi:hypothetical protein
MPVRYSESEIASMLAEPKQLPANFRERLQLSVKRGHRERELDVTGRNGTEFRLILRRSDANPLDFSIILAARPAESSQLFRLRRYNGRSHQHTNQIEGDTFYSFHVHTATERYQDSGMREDAFAEPTDRYGDFHSALGCMLEDCNFDAPHDDQLTLPGGFDL